MKPFIFVAVEDGVCSASLHFVFGFLVCSKGNEIGSMTTTWTFIKSNVFYCNCTSVNFIRVDNQVRPLSPIPIPVSVSKICVTFT